MVNTTKRTKASPAAGARSKEGRPSTARIPPGDYDTSGNIRGIPSTEFVDNSYRCLVIRNNVFCLRYICVG
jgi:hypothetical protein